MKFIVAACMAAAASAQLFTGTNGLTDYLLLDSLTSNHGYYYGGRHNDYLPLLALGGLNGGAAGTTALTDYLLFDQLSHRSYGGHHDYLPLMALSGNTAQATDLLVLDSLSHSNHGRHSNFLPLAVLSGQTTIGTDPTLTNLWALNEFGGGHHSDFNDIAALSVFGGVTGPQLQTAWGLQQLHNGHENIVPFMAATGQALPTDFTSLALLNQFDHSGHRSYYPRHYSRHAPRAVHRGYSPVHRGYPQQAFPQRIQGAVPQRVVQPVAQPVAGPVAEPAN